MESKSEEYNTNYLKFIKQICSKQTQIIKRIWSKQTPENFLFTCWWSLIFSSFIYLFNHIYLSAANGQVWYPTYLTIDWTRFLKLQEWMIKIWTKSSWSCSVCKKCGSNHHNYLNRIKKTNMSHYRNSFQYFLSWWNG